VPFPPPAIRPVAPSFHPPRLMRAFWSSLRVRHHVASVMVLVLLSTACSDPSTAPGVMAETGIPTALGGHTVDVVAEVEDLVTRVLPSIEDDAVAAALRAQLAELAAAAAEGDLSRARRMLDLARAELNENAASAVTVEAVRATLDVIEHDLSRDPH
jgi:hypothetical protein